MEHKLLYGSTEILSNSQISSISYSTSIYKENLNYGVVAMATLSIESYTPLTVGTQYTYTVDGTQIGIFVCKSVSKSDDKYSITLYDKACLMSQSSRQQKEADTEHFWYYLSDGTITSGTYATTSSATLTVTDYFDVEIGLDDSAGYNAISVRMPSLHGLSLGDKFTLDTYVGYVQSISWDIDTYTIGSETTESDNTTTVEDTVIQQGSLITSLTTEVGKVEAKVERKNSVYKQNTVPADTDGTNYDLLVTGDLWYVTATAPTGYTEGKWYACTATGTYEAGDRSVTWTETTDATITSNSSRITVTEGQITQEVTDRQTQYNGLNSRVTTNTSNITVNANAIATEVSNREEAIEGERTYLTNNYSTTAQTATSISNAVLVETNRATTAENGKLDAESTTSGFGWNLTSTGWTVNQIDSGTETAIFTVDSNGAYVKGEIAADSGNIGGWSITSDGNLSMTATDNTRGIVISNNSNLSAMTPAGIVTPKISSLGALTIEPLLGNFILMPGAIVSSVPSASEGAEGAICFVIS